MSEENPETRLPADREDGTDIVDAETEKGEALAVAQARLTGDL